MSEDCFVAIPPEQGDVLISRRDEKRAEEIKYREAISGSKQVSCRRPAFAAGAAGPIAARRGGSSQEQTEPARWPMSLTGTDQLIV